MEPLSLEALPCVPRTTAVDASEVVANGNVKATKLPAPSLDRSFSAGQNLATKDQAEDSNHPGLTEKRNAAHVRPTNDQEDALGGIHRQQSETTESSSEGIITFASHDEEKVVVHCTSRNTRLPDSEAGDTQLPAFCDICGYTQAYETEAELIQHIVVAHKISSSRWNALYTLNESSAQVTGLAHTHDRSAASTCNQLSNYDRLFPPSLPRECSALIEEWQRIHPGTSCPGLSPPGAMLLSKKHQAVWSVLDGELLGARFYSMKGYLLAGNGGRTNQKFLVVRNKKLGPYIVRFHGLGCPRDQNYSIWHGVNGDPRLGGFEAKSSVRKGVVTSIGGTEIATSGSPTSQPTTHHSRQEPNPSSQLSAQHTIVQQASPQQLPVSRFAATRDDAGPGTGEKRTRADFEKSADFSDPEQQGREIALRFIGTEENTYNHDSSTNNTANSAQYVNADINQTSKKAMWFQQAPNVSSDSSHSFYSISQDPLENATHDKTAASSMVGRDDTRPSTIETAVAIAQRPVVSPQTTDLERPGRMVWTPAEDDAIRRGIQRHGYQWDLILIDPTLNLSHRSVGALRSHFCSLPYYYNEIGMQSLGQEPATAPRLSPPSNLDTCAQPRYDRSNSDLRPAAYEPHPPTHQFLEQLIPLQLPPHQSPAQQLLPQAADEIQVPEWKQATLAFKHGVTDRSTRVKNLVSCDTMQKLFAQATAGDVFPSAARTSDRILVWCVLGSNSTGNIVEDDQEDHQVFLHEMQQRDGTDVVEIRARMV